MIIEVTIRYIALGKLFWKSPWNIADIFLVALCILTLGYLSFESCGNRARNTEAFADTLLLVIRNGVQFGRLVVVIR
ncbi:hypothetical protein HK102_009401, partial [Quaeritorhiza haematococci]